ncbi:[FeFe] hydrogenase H-cluster maturation GTPase HydF [Clostridium sp. Marseille-P299]|uniref:[FeFe] hydrogenase H-cluster maturation GTPase HydF n=1 Tax=Clostridium sp. Marseille-P299 TaxID=1805477 RepID=UPI00082D6CE7|nr:[FeFe] hydrogenase H-cluster maturation GTPase HydF [Clostridium sp. Marseille-P299]
MSLNDTPTSERVHIGIFGKRNAGKSSIMNGITGQEIAIVSDIKGTTTDPVYKTMELLPLGPVVMIDTPGLDDDSELGNSRIKKSYQILNKTDIAIIVIDAFSGISKEDTELIEIIKAKKIPYILVFNKADLLEDAPPATENEIYVSTKNQTNINELKEMICSKYQAKESKLRIVGDLISPSDFIVLVVPIDKAAPKGRLILPQQQTIRDILDSDATAIVVKEYELKNTLANLGKKPKLVITDSQVFAKVSADTPDDILLTSFSILFARYKGDLETVVKGAKVVDSLVDGDKILISEGCTHHRQCDDIGTVKLPRLITQYTGKQIQFNFSSGTEFPENISDYKMIVHCGGCMLNEREMKYRLACAKDANIPITNYGILIAYLNGILKRSVKPFPYIYEMLDN